MLVFGLDRGVDELVFGEVFQEKEQVIIAYKVLYLVVKMIALTEFGTLSRLM
ncbi:hypothetical protein [Listeria newyorkensis]|uniref:hypothetical protein n=1 Tax=Listeria newyorkensis TaxID=1497681 RepID=UPI001484DE7D|nr:hypothetical protein [Listeria newyorkensis]